VAPGEGSLVSWEEDGRRWDVVVAGAGPAGALAAYKLAREGVSVLLVERQSFPRWKVCGACLSPGALEILDAVGLGDVVRNAGGIPLIRMRLFAGRHEASLALRGSMVLSRMALDQALVSAAVRAGATFRPETRATVEGLQSERRRVRLAGPDLEEEVVEARVVIDATGLVGCVRGERPSVSPDSRVGLGAVLEGSSGDVPPGELHMAVGARGYVGLVRLEDGTLDVAAAVDPDALAGRTPAAVVGEILSESGRPPLPSACVHSWRGTPALTRSATATAEARLLRAGDAAGYVEPFSGEGICWALAAGLSAAGAAEEGVRQWRPERAAAWAAIQRQVLGRSKRLCHTLAWGLRRPRIVRSAVAALALAPSLAAPLVRRAGRAPAVGIFGPSRAREAT
jgi:flavin-dependent dehydrogenase